MLSPPFKQDRFALTLYTFLPARSDGVATTIAMLDLNSDNEAVLEAVQLLEDHKTAKSVEIWQGSRRGLSCVRDEANPIPA